MSTVNPTKRFRRTKENIEKDLFDAAIRVIEKSGFSGLTVTSLTKAASAEPPVFYNRYKDMTDFIDKFVRSYDYWLKDTITIDYTKGSAIKNIENIIVNLLDLLHDNICMQKLIAWEMNEDNLITRRTSQNRDNNCEPLIRYFEEEFKNCNINFNTATALLIGGIYYLIIHREMGTFNLVDYSKTENIEILKDNIRLIIRNIFSDYNANPSKKQEKTTVEIAIELLKNGVSTDIIHRSTGLSTKAISSLLKDIKQ